MNVLGYVRAHVTSPPYNTLCDATIYATADDVPLTCAGSEPAAIVRAADLDVEQAVERAARVAYEQREAARWATECAAVGGVDRDGEETDPDGWKRWEACTSDYQDGHRNVVRPIVLAALGVES